MNSPPGDPQSKSGGFESLFTAYRKSQEYHRAQLHLEGSGEVHLGGFSGASLPFFLAAARGILPGPTLILTSSEDEAEELREELATFAGEAHIFPAWESLFLPNSPPDGETYRERLEALLRLAGGWAGFLVAPVLAAIQPVPWPDDVQRAGRRIRVGERIEPSQLARELEAKGFRRITLVEKRGEYSLRGDIFDFFPHDGPHAIRAEFFSDSIEAIRSFLPETQKSIPKSEVKEREFFLPEPSAVFQECFRGGKEQALLFDHLKPRLRILLWEPEAVFERAGKIFHNLLGGSNAEQPLRSFFQRMRSHGLVQARSGPPPAGSEGLSLDFGTVERFRGIELGQVITHLAERLQAGFRITVWCENDAEGERFQEILQDHGIDSPKSVEILVGQVRRGFSIGELRALILGSRELFNRQAVRRVRRREHACRPIESFLELSRGDLVVHLVHGIGRFLGTETFEKEEVLQEFLAVEFRGGVIVYVPVSKIDLIQKYIGSGGKVPVLDKVGGSGWKRKKEMVQQALLDFAGELLELQAIRSSKQGIVYPTDTDWQRQFEASFPFEETPDQIEATVAIKEDMESSRPMDRLLCGDVGYGKTELAMRAAFKVVNSGKQVAMLVPTTVLGEQHYRTFRERMAEFPLRIEVLSRFRSPKKQREIIEGAARGEIDIVIGTHRLLSGDVVFKDLGLVVIDEEQRFGVAAKEKLKRFRSLVDILTLTATPIPRTLHMSLLGIRDISNLTTPPEGRSPVATEILEFDRRRVREVILRELNRDGQVYFVHNRVQDIDQIHGELQHIVPEAIIEHGHGQMSEDELEKIMVHFIEGRIDVLVSTTIIESGIDIPNVNTIFINEADRYGLADLHQLRGRVGRGKHQAYCYLILPQHRRINPEARKRIQTIREFAELGAGFQIAMRDLEIRGAGNILGPEQSGHISMVGYETYCRLLEKAVKGFRNEEYSEPVSVEVELNLEAFLPEEYLPGWKERIEMYRRISLQRTLEGIEELARELKDRYGEPPARARRLLEVQKLRVLATQNGISSISRDKNRLILKGRERMKKILDGAGRRVQIIGPQTAVVHLSPPGRQVQRITDEAIFRILLDWLQTGTFREPKSIFQVLRGRAISQTLES